VIYFFDTNVLSEIQRSPWGDPARRYRVLEADPNHVLATSIIVAGEMRFGALKKGSARLQQRVEEVLSRMKVFPLGVEVDVFYARVRNALEQKGEPIGGNDVWIAAHALAHDAVLVTDNVREFHRVAGLRVENWLRP
jgi:tRNA(fMet)-specific endonuclease VapC